MNEKLAQLMGCSGERDDQPTMSQVRCECTKVLNYSVSSAIQVVSQQTGRAEERNGRRVSRSLQVSQ